MPMKHLQSVTINHIFAATHVCAEITPVFSGPGVRLDIQGVSPLENNYFFTRLSAAPSKSEQPPEGSFRYVKVSIYLSTLKE